MTDKRDAIGDSSVYKNTVPDIDDSDIENNLPALSRKESTLKCQY